MANTKKTGTFKGKSNKLGHGGRAAQLKAKGVPGGVIGAIAQEEEGRAGAEALSWQQEEKEGIVCIER